MSFSFNFHVEGEISETEDRHSPPIKKCHVDNESDSSDKHDAHQYGDNENKTSETAESIRGKDCRVENEITGSNDIHNHQCDRVNASEMSTNVEDAEEIYINWQSVMESLPQYCVKDIIIDNNSLIKVRADQSMKKLYCQTKNKQSPVFQALKAKCDVVPNQYEGGLKIWECSIDLVKYLSDSEVQFQGTNVLELGCGVGLPGLYAYKRGAHVTFQDYNSEVLTMVTASNIALNRNKEEIINCTLIAGDWSRVQQKLSSDMISYDYILTSETIYRPESYKKLHDIMKCLIKPEGVIYLAAKTCYFGVGGGTREFEEFLDKEGMLEHVVCKEYSEGVQREILKITLKKNNSIST